MKIILTFHFTQFISQGGIKMEWNLHFYHIYCMFTKSYVLLTKQQGITTLFNIFKNINFHSYYN